VDLGGAIREDGLPNGVSVIHAVGPNNYEMQHPEMVYWAHRNAISLVKVGEIYKFTFVSGGIFAAPTKHMAQ